jgi:hypothetical protein
MREVGDPLLHGNEVRPSGLERVENMGLEVDDYKSLKKEPVLLFLTNGAGYKRKSKRERNPPLLSLACVCAIGYVRSILRALLGSTSLMVIRV